jgi:Protein of unknown function (DUF938)
MNPPPDARQYAPATARNREPILQVLLQFLPIAGKVLEISSGTGEHAVFFAPHFSPRAWIPSDPNPAARASIEAWRTQSGIDNLRPAIPLDVRDSVWPVEPPLAGIDLRDEPIRAIVNINMIHIAPWAACLGLMAGAKRILSPGDMLYLYGPFKQDGRHTAPSNAAFDASLQSQNPSWGVRDLEQVVAAAAAENLQLLKTVTMPAHNLSLLFEVGR